MKIEIKNGENVYDKIIDLIDEKMANHYHCYSDVLVELRTSVLGKTIEYLKFYGDIPCYQWDKDWYEGGEVELISLIPLCEIEELGDIPNSYLFTGTEEM